MRNVSIPGIFLALIFFFGCTAQQDDQSEAVETALSVKGLQVETSTKSLNKTFTGTLEGERQAVIRAKIGEAVDNIFVAEGDLIKSNAVIIGLDKTGPSSNYIQSKSVFKNAEKNFNKMKYLYDEGAVSESQFDAARTDYEVARANHDAARRLVELKTPIAGTVTSIDVSVGDYVSPGQPVGTVATIEILRMKLGVNSSDVGYFNVGDKVSVHVESVSDSVASGRVVTIARSADPVTRTFQVEIEIDNEGYMFNPGMFARAEIVIQRLENILIVPRRIVINRNDKHYLYVIKGDRVSLRDVELGVEFDGESQVLSGIAPGDTVVAVGQEYLDDGFLVKLTGIESIQLERDQD
jgi:RND family efflux transporter MFP subunit